MRFISKKYIFLFIFTSFIFLAGCANVKPSTSDQNKNKTSDTTAWQVYENKEQSFQVKYPKDWYATDLSEGGFSLLLTDYKPGDDDIHDGIFVSPSDKSIDEHLKDDKKSLKNYKEASFQIYTMSEGYNDIGEFVRSVYIPLNDKVFEISMGETSPEKKYFETIFPGVIDTLTTAQNSQTNTSTTTAAAQNTNQTTNNTVVVDPNSLEYKSLHNTKYGFTVSYPTTELVCLNQLFCGEPEKQSKDFTLFNVSSFELSIIKNGTGLSGADVGKYYLDLNMQYAEGAKENYTDAKYSTFAGQKSFEFIAHTSLEERGDDTKTVNKEAVLITNSERVEDASFGMVLKEPHKVIYFEKDGVLYRIYFAINDPIGNEILEKFKFD